MFSDDVELYIDDVDVKISGDDLFPFTSEEIAEICYEQYLNGSWNEDALKAWGDPDIFLSPEELFHTVELSKLTDYIDDEYARIFNR